MTYRARCTARRRRTGARAFRRRFDAWRAVRRAADEARVNRGPGTVGPIREIRRSPVGDEWDDEPGGTEIHWVDATGYAVAYRYEPPT